MKYLHTMVRVTNLEESLRFYCDGLGLEIIGRYDNTAGRFTLVYIAAPGDEQAQIELTWNWDPEVLEDARNFGHIAFQVEDIYATCQHLLNMGYTINRPPRDGFMAFLRSPDLISIELLQQNNRRPPALPWTEMKNIGRW